ncbi:hypothetical protein [Mucilaginibacter phyllosphaerae]
MEKHYGKIVEYTVRKNGYNITDLANKTFVNRRSIYNWFNQPNLRADIIYKIGCIIRHDFSKDFPELFDSNEFNVITEVKSPHLKFDSNADWQLKYIKLLEQYNSKLIELGEMSKSV